MKPGLADRSFHHQSILARLAAARECLRLFYCDRVRRIAQLTSGRSLSVAPIRTSVVGTVNAHENFRVLKNDSDAGLALRQSRSFRYDHPNAPRPIGTARPSHAAVASASSHQHGQYGEKDRNAADRNKADPEKHLVDHIAILGPQACLGMCSLCQMHDGTDPCRRACPCRRRLNRALIGDAATRYV